METGQSRQYEMGYTTAEFGNVICGNFSAEKSPFSCHMVTQLCWEITLYNTDMRIRIDIEKKQPRVLGAISLPVLQVTFQLLQATEEQADFFFDKFFKYFHKGGG